MRIRKLFAPALVLALVAILVGACTDSGTEISLIAGESSEDYRAWGYAYEGEEVTSGGPTITVQAGEEVTLTVKNLHGQYFGPPVFRHDLAILPDTAENREDPPSGPTLADEVFWDVWVRGSGSGLHADESETITFVPDEPGEYLYVCTIRGHAAQGMLGEFIVEGA